MPRDLGNSFSKGMHFITTYIITMNSPYWVDAHATWVSLNKNMDVKIPIEFFS